MFQINTSNIKKMLSEKITDLIKELLTKIQEF